MHTVLTSVVWLVAVLQPPLPLLFGSFANDFGKLANIKKPSLAAKLHSDINSNSGVKGMSKVFHHHLTTVLNYVSFQVQEPSHYQ